MTKLLLALAPLLFATGCRAWLMSMGSMGSMGAAAQARSNAWADRWQQGQGR